MSNDQQASGPIRVRFGPAPEEAQRVGALLKFTCDGFADGWAAAGYIARSPQGLVIARLEVLPTDPSDLGLGVTSRALRSVPVTEIIERVHDLERTTPEEARQMVGGDPALGERLVQAIQRALAGLAYTDTSEPRTADAILAAHAPTAPGPGRAPLPDELLRAVAEGYLAETGPGKPRGAVKRVAAALGRPEQTVSKWVARARREGWLGPGAVGREGGVPGPRLLEARKAQG